MTFENVAQGIYESLIAAIADLLGQVLQCIRVSVEDDASCNAVMLQV